MAEKDSLLSMGFSEDQVQNALKITAGNIDNALEILLSQSFPDGESGQNEDHLISQASYEMGTLGANETLTQCEMSQYTLDCGQSACTPIACQAAVEILSRLKAAQKKRESFQPNTEIITEILLSGVQAYQMTMAGRSVEHSSVEEALQLIPGLMDNFQSIGDEPMPTLQGLTSNPQGFSEIFQQVYSLEGMPETAHIAVIITKPPETVLVILPPRSQADGVHYIFDSHSRPSMGLDGAYLYSVADISGLERRLKQLFPFQDLGFGGDDMASIMYNSFDATPLLLKQLDDSTS
mmetsp:Transcript_9071/g.11800  ORF Transcript_9071/g.11800 Transcript_9071/m.11800 type:complete len:293 (-) Transcript_9071:404-1282(-)